MSQQFNIGPNRREWLLAALGMVSACGGVDSGGTGTGDRSTLAVGAITGFGSIIVNGVRFDEISASIDDDDGRARSSTELRLGMRTAVIASAVTVVDGVSTAAATSIRIRSDLEGPVDAVDLAAGRLSLLGQTVLITGTTVLDLGGGTALAAGDRVEVHATLDVVQGRYVATRIERRTTLVRSKLRGVVAELDLVGRTVRIGALLIDWSSVAPGDPATVLAPGRFLRVAIAASPTSGVRTALAIEADSIPLDDRDRLAIEGRITAFTTLTTFEVNGVRVDARGAVFEGGAAGIALGRKVEVVGSLRGGVVLATRVEAEDDEGDDMSYELNGSIESVDAAAMHFTVRGVTVMWGASTRFDSSSAADLVVGRRVEVRGRLSSDGLRIDATLIHVED